MSSITSASTSTASLAALSMLRGGHHKHGSRSADQLAEQLFSKLDTSGQGYIKKADLESAFSNGSAAAKSVSGSDIDALFTRFDTNGDGQLTKQEFTDSVKKLADQLSQQLRVMNAQGMAPNGAGQGPQDASVGFTKDELSSQLQQISSSDSARSDLLSSLVQNFSQADSNGDGRIDAHEALDFAKQNLTSASSNTVASSNDVASSSDEQAKVLQQLMKLLHTYGEHADQHQQTSALQAVTA